MFENIEKAINDYKQSNNSVEQLESFLFLQVQKLKPQQTGGHHYEKAL